MEEEDTIQPMDDELVSPEEPSLRGGHVLFREMGITPPPAEGVMDVCSVMFDYIKKRIAKRRHIYFQNDPQNPVSVSTEKVITGNTRNYPRKFMSTGGRKTGVRTSKTTGYRNLGCAARRGMASGMEG